VAICPLDVSNTLDMARHKRIQGKCCLCGYEGLVTFEHVPPQAAFNKSNALRYRGMDYLKASNNSLPWEIHGVRGEIQQGGAGEYTLCERCNNNTGSWYADTYVHFVECAVQSIGNPVVVRSEGREFVNVLFRDVYPLQVIKQVLTMFASVIGPAFSEANPELCRFVLDKERTGLDSRHVGIYCYVLHGTIQRRTGVTACMSLAGGSPKHRILAEFSTIPFGYVLEFEPKGGTGLWDITDFANLFSYDSASTFTWPVPIRENNTMFPGDYRTRDQVRADYLQNKLAELRSTNPH